jgi:PadR family transcriptional regulator AphA
MMRVGKVYEAAAPSQYYAEPKKLERLGLLASSKEPGRTRERTVYRLTAAGEAALREWLAEPTRMPRLPGEANVRMIAGDFVDDATLRDSLLAMRGEIAEMRVALAEGEQRAASLPHRERYLLLSHSLARRFLDAYDGWLDEIERELD